jgi:hypothetical protein
MTKQEIKNTFQASVADDLLKYGFKLNKQDSVFTRKTTYGWDKFEIGFLNRRSGWDVDFGMLIRINEVEKIYHTGSYFEKKYHNSTPTIGIDIGTYLNDEENNTIFLDEDSDLDEFYTMTVMLFKEVALPFFEKYNSVQELDNAINVEEGKSIFSGYKYEGNLGIILAKLTNNPKFDFFENKYRNYYTVFCKGFYLKEFEDILKAVEGVYATHNKIPSPMLKDKKSSSHLFITSV